VAAEALLLRFWEWRVRGRYLQTLHQDLELFLTVWQPRVGWQICSTVYREAMKLQDWDISQGGLRSAAPATEPPKPRRRKGGLTAYG
jgi:hypothetical protein